MLLSIIFFTSYLINIRSDEYHFITKGLNVEFILSSTWNKKPFGETLKMVLIGSSLF